MIKKIVLHRFKQFKGTELDLRGGVTFVVGGNNSGKSTILHAAAIWEFCRTIIETEKGTKALWHGAGGTGIGLGDDEFTPITVPSLRHLWTNLKTQKDKEPDGYTLKIKMVWESAAGQTDKYLGFGLALANDRLFIKVTDSNLIAGDDCPKVVYLPPFAGMTDKEARLTPAMRNRLVGQGLSGGVIRNVLYDMFQTNQSERERLKGTKAKLASADLEMLRKTDPWELLAQTLQEVFKRAITIAPFNERYHSYIRIESYQGDSSSGRFKKYPNYNARDLMVEGSGFLQWLSVYALLLSPEYKLILLDEPDAHLHTALQSSLVTRLREIAESKDKQILLATHSSEIIKSALPSETLRVQKGTAKYLADEQQKIALLAGIGTEYSPRLYQLQINKKLLLVEGVSDERLLRKLALRLGHEWPANVVIWQWSAGHKERRQLFGQLKAEIDDLVTISIRDRDDEPDATTNENLIDSGHTGTTPGFTALKWRRRHIENYLLSPVAIARAARIDEQIVRDHFEQNCGLAVPANFVDSDVVMTMRDARGKPLFLESATSIESMFGVSREAVADVMMPDEIPIDIKTFINAILNMAA